MVQWSGGFYLPSLVNWSLGHCLFRRFQEPTLLLEECDCSVIKGLLGGDVLERSLWWLAQVALPLASDSQLTNRYGFSSECCAK